MNCDPHYQIATWLMPILDFDRLSYCPETVNEDTLQRAFQVIGISEADVAAIKDVVIRLFRGQQAVLSDPDLFWSLRSFIVDDLGFTSLKTFLGKDFAYSLPAGV